MAGFELTESYFVFELPFCGSFGPVHSSETWIASQEGSNHALRVVGRCYTSNKRGHLAGHIT